MNEKQETKLPIEEIAKRAFETQERVTALSMANVPMDYAKRQQAAIDYAVARQEAATWQRNLDSAINNSVAE